MRARNNRKQAIREIVREENVRTQRMLVEKLNERGFNCTQATISRDITEMDLRKLPEGVYVLAEDLHFQRMVRDLVVSLVRSNNLILVKTTTGTAAAVAAALDAAELPGVLGSIAGDDTILIIGQDDDEAIAFVKAINKLRLE